MYSWRDSSLVPTHSADCPGAFCLLLVQSAPDLTHPAPLSSENISGRGKYFKCGDTASLLAEPDLGCSMSRLDTASPR